MKYFLDTEFSERGPVYPIQLISSGIVAEDGRTLYVENYEFNWDSCNPWVKENVFPHLKGPRMRLSDIAKAVVRFVGEDKPEFWGYYADYDWVVFCQMFGSMVDLPKGWPMYCRDLKQWCHQIGNPQLPKQNSMEHNALNDAQWNKEAFYFLTSFADGKTAD